MALGESQTLYCGDFVALNSFRNVGSCTKNKIKINKYVI